MQGPRQEQAGRSRPDAGRSRRVKAPEQRPGMPHVGQVVERKYRVDRMLGAGGMGAVYAATHIITGKRVALKWLLPAASDTEGRDAEERLLREAQATARIDHPNVVNVFDVGGHAAGLYLVMELLRGESLGDRLERAPIEPEQAIALLMPALRGVSAAHAQNVVHRDLKPDNIFLCTDAEGVYRDTKVLDFGISKLTTGEQLGLTATGMLMGTPCYMAPEQVQGHCRASPQLDVYALGVILYEILADAFPFDARNYSALLFEIVMASPRHLRERRSDLPRELCDVVMQAMAKKPARRFADVASLAEALEPFANGVRFAPAQSTPFVLELEGRGLLTSGPAVPVDMAAAQAALLSAAVRVPPKTSVSARPTVDGSGLPQALPVADDYGTGSAQVTLCVRVDDGTQSSVAGAGDTLDATDDYCVQGSQGEPTLVEPEPNTGWRRSITGAHGAPSLMGWLLLALGTSAGLWVWIAQSAPPGSTGTTGVEQVTGASTAEQAEGTLEQRSGSGAQGDGATPGPSSGRGAAVQSQFSNGQAPAATAAAANQAAVTPAAAGMNQVVGLPSSADGQVGVEAEQDEAAGVGKQGAQGGVVALPAETASGSAFGQRARRLRQRAGREAARARQRDRATNPNHKRGGSSKAANNAAQSDAAADPRRQSEAAADPRRQSTVSAESNPRPTAPVLPSADLSEQPVQDAAKDAPAAASKPKAPAPENTESGTGVESSEPERSSPSAPAKPGGSGRPLEHAPAGPIRIDDL